MNTQTHAYNMFEFVRSNIYILQEQMNKGDFNFMSTLCLQEEELITRIVHACVTIFK